MSIWQRIMQRLGVGSSAEADEASVLDRVRKLMTDDAEQAESVNQVVRMGMACATGVDTVEGASGEFGRCVDNPIPVPGPLGEVCYVSNLILPNGSHLVGHRLGSIGRRDVYETVSMDGTRWDILYFDMYHLRRSRFAPAGYELCRERSPFLRATNLAMESFPTGIYEAVDRCAEALVGFPVMARELRALQIDPASRPPAHIEAMGRIELAGRTADRRPQTYKADSGS